jgi:uncharacterized protein (DUF433 family)
MGKIVGLLGLEQYSFAQVDRVLRLHGGTARRWIDGYTRQGKQYNPVVRPEPTGSDLATWGEFLECRFLSEYREAGVPLRNMRPVIQRLREDFGLPYPLASWQMWMEPQGRDLVAHVQDALNVTERLWVVRTNQDLLPIEWTTPAARFNRALTWHDKQIVSVRPSEDPLLEVNPLRAFGEPVIAGRSIRTDTLARLVRAGDPPEMVASLYDLDVTQVEAAISFEEGPALAA